MALSNLYADIPTLQQGEQFLELLRYDNLRIERIVSSGQVEPQLYVQEQDEWVILLQGEAELMIGTMTRRLIAGDFLFIPAHTPHKVMNTSRETQCLWLAVHLYPKSLEITPR